MAEHHESIGSRQRKASILREFRQKLAGTDATAEKQPCKNSGQNPPSKPVLARDRVDDGATWEEWRVALIDLAGAPPDLWSAKMLYFDNFTPAEALDELTGAPYPDPE